MAEPKRIPVYDIIPPAGRGKGAPKKKAVEAPKLSEPEPEARDESADLFLQKLAGERPGSQAPWVPTVRVRKIPRGAIFAGIAAAIVLGFVWAVTATFAQARIRLVADKAFAPFSFTVSFDAKQLQPDYAAKRLPLQVVRKATSLKKDYPATGEGTVSTRSRGTITIYNTYSSAPQTLIATTRFASPTGKIFRLAARTIIPGNGSVSAEVVADKPGPDYNIAPTTFSIPAFQGTARYGKIYGKSSEAFRGGASGPSKIVTSDDIRKAEEALSREVFDALEAEVTSALGETTVTIGERATRYTVTSIAANARAGDAVESFTVEVKAGVDALLFNEVQVAEIAKREVDVAELAPDIQTPKFDFAYTASQPANFSAGTLTLKVDGSLNIAKSIDAAALAERLAGKTESEMKRELLALPGIQEARVTLWPFWARRAPDSITRITITIE